jgi:hypothetical protein
MAARRISAQRQHGGRRKALSALYQRRRHNQWRLSRHQWRRQLSKNESAGEMAAKINGTAA